ncbi:Cys/Met metabolism PLP-dependent enzyme-domain-containing protein [Neocallimastix sp. 'constans']
MISTVNQANELNSTNPTLSEEDFGFSTRAVHVGQEPDPVTGAVIPSISLSTTFKQSAAGVNTGYEYSRTNNPSRNSFERAVASLEGAKYAIRMRQHEKNALAVAKFLEAHPLVEAVYYPGLESHKQHELAKKQMKGFGAMMSIRIKGNLDTSNKFLSSLKIFTLAESLGGVESLCEIPCIMTHAAVPPEERAKLGITDTLIRLSVGIEETEDIIRDLDQALKLANEVVVKH